MIADLASIREQCEIAEEVIIGRNTMVELRARIGPRTVIQTGSHITGDITIESDVFFGPEAVTVNDRYMGRRPGIGYTGPVVRKGASIGCNACLLPGVVIGEGAVIGAGAVVTKDVPDHTVAVGVPATPIKSFRGDGTDAT
jgi:acetyltransferase-like isoleucine patch superfamily enzyme